MNETTGACLTLQRLQNIFAPAIQTSNAAGERARHCARHIAHHYQLASCDKQHCCTYFYTAHSELSRFGGTTGAVPAPPHHNLPSYHTLTKHTRHRVWQKRGASLALRRGGIAGGWAVRCSAAARACWFSACCAYRPFPPHHRRCRLATLPHPHATSSACTLRAAAAALLHPPPHTDWALRCAGGRAFAALTVPLPG